VTISLHAQTTELHQYKFGAASEFRIDSTEIIVSPVIQYYPRGNFAFFLGPSLQYSTDEFNRYDEFGFRFGGIYLFPKQRNKRVEDFVELEFEHIANKYKTTSYDTAVSNIPIKATLVHEYTYSDVSLLFGARLRFLKRFYLGGLAGFKLMWLESINPDTYDYFSYNLYHQESDSPKSTQLGITGALELGVYF